MKTRAFGQNSRGENATMYRFENTHGMVMEVTDFGATLFSLQVPTGKGLLDVVLGYDDPAGYEGPSGTFFGATVGRNANRIAGGKFTLNGKAYTLDVNNGPNNLHSGLDFYSFRIWQVKAVTDNAITFALHSPDGDQGYPGALDMEVTYTLTEENSVRIDYLGIPQAETFVNMTNHSYFNLNGHNSGSVLNHTVWLDADCYTPADETSIPTGEIAPVEGTPMDFRTPKAIGRDLSVPYDALELQGGYDHNWEVFCNPCATVSDPESGRFMSVHTDCPGLQFYCGNFLEGETGKDGVSYCYRGGIALETQFYPDAINKPQWAQPITKAGERYHTVTEYKFG
jgi:aldose 1-epimerase